MEANLSVASPFPPTGFVRSTSILAPNGRIPLCRSTWWAGPEADRIPEPMNPGSKITVWDASGILDLIEWRVS
jgi:hypothetical protein